MYSYNKQPSPSLRATSPRLRGTSATPPQAGNMALWNNCAIKRILTSPPMGECGAAGGGGNRKTAKPLNPPRPAGPLPPRGERESLEYLRDYKNMFLCGIIFRSNHVI